MFKSIKDFLKDMVTDSSGHVNSKIVFGILAFVVAVILASLKYDIQYIIAFLAFSAGSFGFSCFDNKSAFQFKNTLTETKTETSTKNTDVKLDAGEVINNAVNKIIKRRGKQK